VREDFLHYLWNYKKFKTTDLKTCNGESVIIKSVGAHNQNSGPDFFNAHIIINDQLWAGNVEMHLKSSDWYLHNHQTDANYDNVILHVVWEHDVEIQRKDQTVIPTLELKNYVSPEVLNNYKTLFTKAKKWINCEHEFAEVDDFLISNWLERLYLERLEQKSETINKLLKASNNDWEAVLFTMLAKNFGLKVNGDAFFSMAKSLKFTVVRKLSNDASDLEALFFGQSGLLEMDIEDEYYLELKSKYSFLKQKFQLDNLGVLPVQFFRLRPSNFPTIRLSQLAKLYSCQTSLFSDIIYAAKKEDFYELFNISTSEYWDMHYNFGVTSKTSKKVLTKSFIDLLIINTIIPLFFAYNKSKGENVDQQIIDLISNLSPEKNTILKKFESLKKINKSALQSQALLQLKNNYCNKLKCLQCAIGNSILKD